MTLTIETASAHHLDRLVEIEKACFDTEAFSRRQISTLLADYNSISLVAVEMSSVVGFIIGTSYFERKSLTAHILTIDVLPGCRRKGVGTKLLLEIEKLFREKGARACQLEVREDNTAALSLYQKAGYTMVAKLKNYYNAADGLYLKKELT